MTWALLSLGRSSVKRAFTHHRPGAAVVLPDGSRASSGGWGGSAGSPHLPVYAADANGGLCIGRSCVDNTEGSGSAGHQQAAPGIYWGIACRRCCTPTLPSRREKAAISLSI